MNIDISCLTFIMPIGEGGDPYSEKNNLPLI